MKRFVALGALTALVLAGCGLISSPPIDNPFNLNGKQTSFTLGPNATAVGNAEVTTTFDNLKDLSNLPATPSSFTYNLGISAIAFGTGCPTTIPSPIQVTLNATVEVSDTDGGTTRTASASTTEAKFTITASGGTVTVGNISNGSMTFSNLGTLINILSTGTGANTAKLTASLITSSTPDLASGGPCTLVVTWGGGSGVVKF
jgi:hypothetical protein